MDSLQRMLCAFALVLCVFGCAIIAVAQSYPNKSIRIIVPYPPGGATDVMARLIAQKLSESWQQVVVVDNMSGASGQTRAVNRGPLAGCERPRVG